MSGQNHHPEDWVLSERKSIRLALAVALMPVPLALLISWLMGDPPWRPKRGQDHQGAVPATGVLEPPAKATRHGHKTP